MTGQAKSTSSLNQDGEPGRKTSKGNIKREPIPKRRKPKIVWIILCSLVAIGTIVYAMIYNNTEVEFHADNDICIKKVQSNTSTDTCYRMVEKKTYPVLANIGLGLLGMILGQIIYCLCNIVEELRQFKSRYNRNICRLFKQCFTGISWKAVIIVGVLDAMGVAGLKQFSFELGDLLYVLGGIGLSPLVSYLLNLNALTEVDHSRFLEEGGLYPAYTLAWDYTCYLEKFLPIFIQHFSNSNTPVQDQQGSNEHLHRDAQPKIRLSSRKLILLFSHNYEKEVKLVDLDNHISKLTDVCEGGYKFPIYGLKYNGREYQYVIQFAKEPLETIQRMCDSEECKPVHNDQLEDQVKLLYRTLSEILKNKGFYRNMCTLVLITGVESLENGGLVKVIMSYIGEDECVSNTNSPGTNSAIIQAQETDDTSELNLADGPCRSTTVNIDDIEGKVQFNRHDHGYFIPENSALFGDETERRVDLLDPKLQFRRNRAKKSNPNEMHEMTALIHDDPDRMKKNNRKQRTPMLSKEQANENGREISTSPPVFSKRHEQQQPTYNRIPPTSINTPTLPSDLSGEPKNQDEDVHCPNKSEERHTCDDNQPRCDSSDGMGNQATCSLRIVNGKEICPKESKKILGL